VRIARFKPRLKVESSSGWGNSPFSLSTALFTFGDMCVRVREAVEFSRFSGNSVAFKLAAKINGLLRGPEKWHPHIYQAHIFQPTQDDFIAGKPDTLLGLFIYLSSRHNIKN